MPKNLKLSPRTLQAAFFVLFVTSVFIGFLALHQQQRSAVAAMAYSLENDEPVLMDELVSESALTYITSLVTMGVSLAGFVVSTVFKVRKDRRDARAMELVIQQKELELERALAELDELKKRAALKS